MGPSLIVDPLFVEYFEIWPRSQKL